MFVGVGLLISAAVQVSPAEIRDTLGQANYPYVAPAIVLYFIAVYFRAARWQYLLSPLRQFPVRRLYPVVVIGYMANNLLPARLGELVRSYYLAQREQFNASSALATIAVERVYDGVTLLAFAAVGGSALLLLGQFNGASATWGKTTVLLLAGLTVALFVGALVFLTLLATTPRFMRVIEWGLKLLPARLRPRAWGLIQTFVQGLSVLNSPRKHLGLFLWSAPVWLFEAAMYFLVSYSFGIDDRFGSPGVLALVVLLVTATSNLVTALPTAIGGIGPFEVVAQQTLIALGVGASAALAYAGFLHLVALWLPVNLAGLILLWKQNLSLRQLVSEPVAESAP